MAVTDAPISDLPISGIPLTAEAITLAGDLTAPPAQFTATLTVNNHQAASGCEATFPPGHSP